jgi:hypothetical protein
VDLAGPRLDRGGRGEREVGLGNAVVLQHPQILVLDPAEHVEVDVVEDRLEQGPASRQPLQLGHGIAPERHQLPLRLEGVAHEIAPRPLRQPRPQRHRVEEEAERPFAALHLRPAVGDQAADHLPFAGQKAEHPQVGGQQDALERRARGVGEPPERLAPGRQGDGDLPHPLRDRAALRFGPPG